LSFDPSTGNAFITRGSDALWARDFFRDPAFQDGIVLFRKNPSDQQRLHLDSNEYASFPKYLQIPGVVVGSRVGCCKLHDCKHFAVGTQASQWQRFGLAVASSAIIRSGGLAGSRWQMCL